MKNSLKKIASIIEDKKSKREGNINEVTAELDKVRADLSKAASVLEVTDDKDEYLSALSTIEINKKLITVLNRRLENVSHPMSKDEYDKCRGEVSSYYKDLKSEYSLRINKELNVLLDTLKEYDNEVNVIIRTYGELDQLSGLKVSTHNVKSSDIWSELDDHGHWYPDFVRWYFRKLGTNRMLHI